MLLDEKSTFSRIDAAFQQQLAVVVEPQWKYLAPYITPSPPPGAGKDVPVIDQLEQWRKRMHPTFGDLDEILNRLYIQPPLPLSVVENIAQQPRIPTSGRDHDGTSVCVLCY